MPLDFDSQGFFELSQDQYTPGDSWPPADSWPLDDLGFTNDVTNPVDPPPSHLDSDFDLFWPQLNVEGLSSLTGPFGPPSFSPSPSTSLAPPPQVNPQPWMPPDIFEIGYQDTNGDWRCNYSGCRSNKVFLRACDLRKHYRSHQKTYFCKERDCHWSKVGFSSSKDCQRHMRSHRPMIKCSAAESLSCTRVFSRLGVLFFMPMFSFLIL